MQQIISLCIIIISTFLLDGVAVTRILCQVRKSLYRVRAGRVLEKMADRHGLALDKQHGKNVVGYARRQTMSDYESEKEACSLF